MAGGVYVGPSVKLASDETVDYPYTFCADNDKQSEAQLCCNDCSKLMCGSCKTHHNLLFKAHTVLDRTQIDDWQVQQTVPEYMCEEHHGKECDMFCHEHDQLCCYVCVSTKHR